MRQQLQEGGSSTANEQCDLGRSVMKRFLALACVLVAASAIAGVRVVERSGPDIVQEGTVPIKSPLVLEYKLEELLQPVSEDLRQYDLDTAVLRAFRLIPHPGGSSLTVDVSMLVYVKEGHDRTMSLRVEAIADGQNVLIKTNDYFEAEETKLTTKVKSFTLPKDIVRAGDVTILIKIGAKED
jgi:hypothetical protein